MSTVGYWIDLTGVKLDDAVDRMLWLQAFPYGEYKHPLYGPIEMNASRAGAMASQVKGGVRGQKLDIDYDHKEYSGKAAGWVNDAEARDDGLWIQVEFTEDGFNAVQKGEYRYFSPEYADEWEHPTTGVTYQDVLFGGALTNRPFLKDILPINMSELADGGDNEVDKFLKQLRETLGLGEDATEAEILQAAQEAAEAEGPEDEEETEEETEEGTEEEETEGDAEQQLAELQNHPVIKKLLARTKSLEEDNRMLRATSKLSEVNATLSDWSSHKDGRKFGLPPATHDDLRVVMLSENGKTAKAIHSFIDNLLDTGLVSLSERGGGSRQPSQAGGGGSAAKALSERTKALQKEQDLDYIDAVQQVAKEDPDLYNSYLEEVYNDVAEV